MKKSYSLLSVILCSIYFATPALAQTTPDPGIDGSLTVSKLDYNLGDAAFTASGFPGPIEVRGSVHFPTGLAGGPYPVLLFLHGRHETCYETADPTNSSLSWPCGSGEQSITSFEGYDYLAQHMASHGYIVISVSANGINAVDNSTADYGMGARAQLMQHHMDLWDTWSTIGDTLGLTPFDSTFIGKLNLSNVGTMGHSRGGEGVVQHALLNESLGSPYGIKAVLTLAPVDFLRGILNETPLMNVAPYCDGDVSDLQGVHFYDDSRYNVSTDESPKHNVLMLGANHNFYNTVWTPGLYPAGTADDWDDIYGSSDDYCGSAGSINNRLTPVEQQSALKAYLSAFFRTYVGNDTTFRPLLEVEDIIPPVSSTLDSTDVFVSYHAPASKRLDINRIETEASETTNTLGGTVAQTGLIGYDVCADDASEADCGLNTWIATLEPHSGSSSELGMPQLGLRWDNATDLYENTIPVANQDFSDFGFIQFRFGVNFDETTIGTVTDFSLELLDASGDSSSVQVDDYTNATYFPPGDNWFQLPKMCFNTIKVPLIDFAGIDLTQIQKIRFRFNQTTAASILIADLCISGEAPPQIITGLGQMTTLPDIKVYPNPTNDNITVDFGQHAADITSIYMADASGRKVISKNTFADKKINIQLSNFEKGIYTLVVLGPSSVSTFKIVKQ